MTELLHARINPIFVHLFKKQLLLTMRGIFLLMVKAHREGILSIETHVKGDLFYDLSLPTGEVSGFEAAGGDSASAKEAVSANRKTATESPGAKAERASSAVSAPRIFPAEDEVIFSRLAMLYAVNCADEDSVCTMAKTMLRSSRLSPARRLNLVVGVNGILLLRKAYDVDEYISAVSSLLGARWKGYFSSALQTDYAEYIKDDDAFMEKMCTPVVTDAFKEQVAKVNPIFEKAEKLFLLSLRRTISIAQKEGRGVKGFPPCTVIHGCLYFKLDLGDTESIFYARLPAEKKAQTTFFFDDIPVCESLYNLLHYYLYHKERLSFFQLTSGGEGAILSKMRFSFEILGGKRTFLIPSEGLQKKRATASNAEKGGFNA